MIECLQSPLSLSLLLDSQPIITLTSNRTIRVTADDDDDVVDDDVAASTESSELLWLQCPGKLAGISADAWAVVMK